VVAVDDAADRDRAARLAGRAAAVDAVSTPSLTSFEQLVQTPASHCPLAQSAAAAQAPPSVQPS
jgi:hypothetical protein